MGRENWIVSCPRHSRQAPSNNTRERSLAVLPPPLEASLAAVPHHRADPALHELESHPITMMKSPLNLVRSKPLADTAIATSSHRYVVLDPGMRVIFSLIERLSQATVPVLLLGETGSGKEVLADWVHRTSRLAARPFVKINCAGLSESVIESELFGHERGAFTGAVQPHQGLFEAADGGTLFLDEVAELPLRTQAKLLRVLESGEFSRLGSTLVRSVRVRLIAATHRDLGQQIESGGFRTDLYFRLNGATLEIPPLRERPLEIVPLARLFLDRAAEHLGRERLALDSDAERMLLQYEWPGNVRELRNVMDCAAALCIGSVVTAEALTLGRPLHLFTPSSRPPASLRVGVEPTPLPPDDSARRADLRGELQLFERAQILVALERSQGNQTRAARLLGVSRRTLTNKLNLYDIDRPRKRRPALSQRIEEGS